MDGFFGSIFAGTCDVLRDKPEQTRVHRHICHIYGHFGDWLCPDSWLPRLAGWMNELKWRVSEWVPGGSCGWAAAALGQGRAGLGAGRAQAALGPRRPRSTAGKIQLRASAAQRGNNQAWLSEHTSLLRVGLRKPRVCKLKGDEKDIEPSMG